MNRRSQIRLFSFLVVPLVIPFLAGCITRSDLAKLDTQLTGQIQAMESRSQSQAAALENQLNAVSQGQQAISEQVGSTAASLAAVQADTKAAMESVQAAERTQLERYKELQKDVLRNRQSAAQFAGQSAEALKRIANFTGQVCQQVEKLNETTLQALIGSYRAEEAALKERLKAVQQSRINLESAAGAGEGKEAVRTAPQER